MATAGISAFTIGNKKNYDRVLQESSGHGVTKMGRHRSYSGGCCWPTREEAQAYLSRTDGMLAFGGAPVYCAVYGLILQGSWETDVDSSQYEQEGFHRLICDARVVW
jgi:hypothetical protein